MLQGIFAIAYMPCRGLFQQVVESRLRRLLVGRPQGADESVGPAKAGKLWHNKPPGQPLKAKTQPTRRIFSVIPITSCPARLSGQAPPLSP